MLIEEMGDEISKDIVFKNLILLDPKAKSAENIDLDLEDW